MNQPHHPTEAGSPIAPSSADPANATLGEILRHARERQGVTLDEVARRTRLPKRHLEELEQNSLAGLPPGMYQRAEVRAYAEAIGLDPQVALGALGRTQAALPRAAAPRLTPRVRAARARRRRARLALTALLLLAVPVVVLGYLWWRQPPGIAAVPPASAEATTAPPAASSLDASGTQRANAAAGQQPVAAPATSPGRAAASANDTPSPPPSTERAEAPRVFEYPELRVITEPAGARVTVDGVGWGQSPLTIRALRAGTRLLRVTLDGYAAQERRVALLADAPRTTVRITLKPLK
jgi:cytoskeletal protein RodZ